MSNAVVGAKSAPLSSYRARVMLKLTLAAAACIAVATGARAAHAEDKGWLVASAGFVGSAVSTTSGGGAGGELSVMTFPHDLELGYGGFLQLQRLDPHGDAVDATTRVAFGAQIGTVVGAEIGLAYRTASGPYGEGPAFHLAPYFSVGVVSVSVRCTAAFLPSNGQAYPLDVAPTFTVKVPIPLSVPRLSWRPGGG